MADEIDIAVHINYKGLEYAAAVKFADENLDVEVMRDWGNKLMFAVTRTLRKQGADIPNTKNLEVYNREE